MEMLPAFVFGYFLCKAKHMNRTKLHARVQEPNLHTKYDNKHRLSVL